jgi:hypothetical protein
VVSTCMQLEDGWLGPLTKPDERRTRGNQWPSSDPPRPSVVIIRGHQRSSSEVIIRGYHRRSSSKVIESSSEVIEGDQVTIKWSSPRLESSR